MNRPLLICLSATRNYGWVTRAFCEANSRWADYIIIVDQMSTDETREICATYDKVILIDDQDMSYSETRRCVMALNRARQIEGDKILIYLAIDEILPANWLETKDAQMILSSKPTDMFVMEWANILPFNNHYIATHDANMYRIFHDDDFTPFDNQNRDMHTHCLPYHYGGLERHINDFPILHFGSYNVKWTYIKNHYYGMIDYDKNHRSIVQLSRYYHTTMQTEEENGDGELLPQWLWKDVDIFELVDTETMPILLDECKKLIQKNGPTHYAKIDIWDEPMLTYLGVEDPRSWCMKLVHAYLRWTQTYHDNILVRGIDKVLKFIV